MADRRRPDAGDILMLEADRRRRRLTFHQEELGEVVAREGLAQLEGLDQPRQAPGDNPERRLIAVGEALNQTGIAQKRFGAVGVIALQLRDVLEHGP